MKIASKIILATLFILTLVGIGTSNAMPITLLSSVPSIPDPVVMILFGASLIGVAGVGRKQLKK